MTKKHTFKYLTNRESSDEIEGTLHRIVPRQKSKLKRHVGKRVSTKPTRLLYFYTKPRAFTRRLSYHLIVSKLSSI